MSKHLRTTYFFCQKKKKRKRLKIVFSLLIKGTEVTDLKNIRLLSSCLQNTIATLKWITIHCIVITYTKRAELSNRLRHVLNKQLVKWTCYCFKSITGLMINIELTESLRWRGRDRSFFHYTAGKTESSGVNTKKF